MQGSTGPRAPSSIVLIATPTWSRLASLLGLGLIGMCVGCTQYRDDPTLPRPAALSGADEFVDEVRQVSADRGLVAAKDFVSKELVKRDDSKGRLETRLVHTSRDTGFTYPDAIVTLPESRRKAVGIAFIPGMKAKGGLKPSKPVLALAAASEEAGRMGFDSTLIPAISRGQVAKNAEAMSASLATVFEESDEVILLAKSKGSHDLVHYLLHHGSELPAEQRAKLKAAVILGGTVQGSFVADWIANHSDAWATGTRAMLVLTGRSGQLKMLRNVAQSPWTDVPEGFPRESFPNLTFINLVVIPGGEDGRPIGADWSPLLMEQIQKTAGWESPNDSLVETAAGTIPEFIDAPQWIVRTTGTHAFPKGKYLDGSKVTPNTPPLEDGTLNPECGREIMNAFLRALPASVLGD